MAGSRESEFEQGCTGFLYDKAGNLHLEWATT